MACQSVKGMYWHSIIKYLSYSMIIIFFFYNMYLRLRHQSKEYISIDTNTFFFCERFVPSAGFYYTFLLLLVRQTICSLWYLCQQTGLLLTHSWIYLIYQNVSIDLFIKKNTFACIPALWINNSILTTLNITLPYRAQQFFTSSKSVKLILWRSLSSSAWSGTDIWVVYLMWEKEWGVRALLRPAPGVDSGEISLVRRLSTTAAESFFLFFSEDRLPFFCTPQSWWTGKTLTLLFIMHVYVHSDMCITSSISRESDNIVRYIYKTTST